MLPTEAEQLIIEAWTMPYIAIMGIFTHLAESEETGKGFTEQQLETLQRLIIKLQNMGIEIPYRHYSCTAALASVASYDYTFARLGLGIYGLWPSERNKQIAEERFPGFSLKPVLTWKTAVVQVKTISAGSFIGYGRTHYTTRDTTIAILPVGYWEGYDRALSNKGMVLIKGVYAPVVGRISMNVTIVDVTDVPDIMIGQEVTLLGDAPYISAEALAAHLGTINWEVVTHINPLLPRMLKP